jgi:hypothetical protein
MFSKLTTLTGKTTKTGAVLWNLLRYDVIFRLRGFQGIYRDVTNLPVSQRQHTPRSEQQLAQAFQIAASLYGKHVRCLQRSAVLVRMLRQRGWAATLVIGYRATPFLGHAWVEIDGKVWNDSSEYQRRLQTLDRLEALR